MAAAPPPELPDLTTTRATAEQSLDSISRAGKPFTELADALLPAARARKRAERFVVATAEHDAMLRALLRDNPMPGPIQVSLEREPNYFDGAIIDGPESTTIVAIENGRAICCGAASVRVRYLNGSPTRIGYLGSLRLNNTHRGRATILLRAYQHFRELHGKHPAPPPIYLSSILAKNEPAIRFLERNLPEMPTYTRIGELVAVMIRPRRRRVSLPAGTSIRHAAVGDLSAIADFLNEQARQYQFAPFWTVQGIQACTGLSASDFHLMHNADGKLLACGAIWDQRRFRQNVVRGYSRRLQQLRPLLNIGARLLGRSPLEEVGHVISLGFASHVAAASTESLIALLQSLRCEAHQRKLEFLITSFDSLDPRLGSVRSEFGGREYPSRLYVAHWNDGRAMAASLDDRLLNPDVSLL